jgi:hypothetical protein
MPPSTLPTPRRFITDLLNSLPSPDTTADADANPLSAVPEPAKKQLLSLQVLFPNELLPALDLLDRRLVTRLRVKEKPNDCTIGNGHDEGGPGSDAQMADANTTVEDIPTELHSDVRNEDHRVAPSVEDDVMTDAPNNSAPSSSVYYVRSAQQRSSRYNTSYDTTASYEVRLLPWNCSCPAFAFAAFPPESGTTIHTAYEQGEETAEDTDTDWIFGGVSLGDAMPPVCKHLLACVLVEKCEGLFGGVLEERRVDVEEAAGWAAGWGD